MVREIRLEVDFSLCTPQEFFEAIFAEEGLKIYHKLNSTEEGAEVSPWIEGERTVSFYKNVELPTAVAYIFGCAVHPLSILLSVRIGTSKMPVKELQKLEWHGDGSFTVYSHPELQINTGYTFTGTTELNVRSKNRGSEVTVLIRCEASGPYGMIAFIESKMETEARAGVENFLTFCEARIAEKKVDRLPCSEADSDSLPFYDIQYETMSQCSISDSAILEMRDPNGMLTTEAIILTRLKHLEEELAISQAGMEVMTKKLVALEGTLLQSRRQTTVALVGCTALSFALVTTVLLLKRYPSN